jgi:hypothetical protein
METKEVVSIMAAVIFAAQSQGKDAHRNAAEATVSLFQTVSKIKTTEVLRFG